ncbi:MAG: V-type ATPase subunit subunit G family protein [Planctomycetota bacterium]
MAEPTEKGKLAVVRSGESILPAIAEKERELENRLREAREGADRELATLRKEQEERVAEERERLAAERDRQVQEALQKVESELQAMGRAAQADAEALNQQAHRRMDRAVEAAVRRVLPGGDAP